MTSPAVNYLEEIRFKRYNQQPADTIQSKKSNGISLD